MDCVAWLKQRPEYRFYEAYVRFVEGEWQNLQVKTPKDFAPQTIRLQLIVTNAVHTLQSIYEQWKRNNGYLERADEEIESLIESLQAVKHHESLWYFPHLTEVPEEKWSLIQDTLKSIDLELLEQLKVPQPTMGDHILTWIQRRNEFLQQMEENRQE